MNKLFTDSIPEDIKDKYWHQCIIMPINGENRIECIFPKEHDENTNELIKQLTKTQEEWLQQHQEAAE